MFRSKVILFERFTHKRQDAPHNHQSGWQHWQLRYFESDNVHGSASSPYFSGCSWIDLTESWVMMISKNFIQAHVSDLYENVGVSVYLD